MLAALVAVRGPGMERRGVARQLFSALCLCFRSSESGDGRGEGGEMEACAGKLTGTAADRCGSRLDRPAGLLT